MYIFYPLRRVSELSSKRDASLTAENFFRSLESGLKQASEAESGHADC